VISDVNRNLSGISDASSAVSDSGRETLELAEKAADLSTRLQQLTGRFKT
jgi:methyl-accepting chemotaxis protein